MQGARKHNYIFAWSLDKKERGERCRKWETCEMEASCTNFASFWNTRCNLQRAWKELV